ncbi:MAG: universal stress protein [Betaproteobacteria bacterium]|jgi:nucleotide-binding universal stress UspA family protein
MFKHILMPTDGSAHSEKAIERGFELAKLCGAKVTGIHVMRDFQMIMASEAMVPASMEEDMDKQSRSQAESFLAFVKTTAQNAGVACETLVVKGHQPYDAIVDAANEQGCDLIVMTSRYRKGLSALILGSEASRVLHRSSIPVLTFRAIMSADHPDKKKKR